MYCKNCGEQIDDNSKFCNNCGTQIVKEQNGKSQYVGEIKKCPYCGAQISAFQEKCDICGFELRNIETSNSVKRFKEEIVRIKQKIKTQEKGIFVKKNITNKNDIEEELVSFITSYPIPNTREDIIEFFILAKSNVNNIRLNEDKINTIDGAWLTLFDKSYQKAEIVLSDKELDKFQEEYVGIHNNIDRQIKKYKIKNAILWIVYIACLVGGCGFLFFITKKPIENEDKYLTSIVKEIEIDIENKDFVSARLKANKIRANEGNSTHQGNWDKQREDLLKIIDEEIKKINN